MFAIKVTFLRVAQLLLPQISNTQSYTHHLSTTIPAVEEAIEFANLHKIVYNAENAVCQHENLFPENITCHAYFESILGSEVMIVTSSSKNYVAVIWAATNENIDWIIDAHAGFTPFGPKHDPYDPQVLVHKGFNKDVFDFGMYNQRILPTVQGLIAKEEYKGFRVISTGHSLGAGCSQLTGVALALDLPHQFVEILNYGCPLTGNEKWMDFVNENEYISDWRFVHEDDIVARIWIGPKYKHVGHTFQLDPESSYLYYLHYGDEELGYAPIPENWTERALNNTAKGWADHSLSGYIDYFETKSTVDPDTYYHDYFEAIEYDSLTSVN